MSVARQITMDVRWKAVEDALRHEQERADVVPEEEPPAPLAAEPLPGRTCRR